MKKYFLYGTLLLVLTTTSTLLLLQIWQNNREVPAADTAEIRQHFDKSVRWLNNNYSQLEHSNNPILWWFIKQAAASSGDETLNRLYKKFKKDHIDTQAANLSTPMFNELYRPRVPDITRLSHLQDYQIFFFYSFSCDATLGKETIIKNQLEANFCAMHFIHPRCVTHQLMGLRFMQRFQCGFDNKVKTTINTLQQTLVTELNWDFRVTDAYIQRVLMLLDTGAFNQVKPVWIQRILDAQNDDGGWDDLYPLLQLTDNKVLALTSTTIKIKKPGINFHASAQAIWLLSLLLEASENPPR